MSDENYPTDQPDQSLNKVQSDYPGGEGTSSDADVPDRADSGPVAEREGPPAMQSVTKSEGDTAPRDVSDPTALESWTKKELYERAKAEGVRGRSKMTKRELIAVLSERIAGPTSPVTPSSGPSPVRQEPAQQEPAQQQIDAITQTEIEQRAQIVRRLRDLRAELVNELQTDADETNQDIVTPGDITRVATHPADQDSEGVQRHLSLAQNTRATVDRIDAALQRVDQGTYGRCTQCGRQISAERINAIPYTAFCARCATAEASAKS